MHGDDPIIVNASACSRVVFGYGDAIKIDVRIHKIVFVSLPAWAVPDSWCPKVGTTAT